MKGWGRVRLLGALSLGFWLAVGCGGRTDSFDDYYYDGDDDGGGNGAVANSGGAGPTAGRPNRAGAANGGSRPIGGIGGASSGGASIAGSGPVGGFGAGGSFGGSPFGGFGGTISFGGFSGAVFGGFGGTFPIGGFGGSVVGGFGGQPQDCQSCLLSSCSAQFIECIQDFGCVSIIACAQARGCQGIDCYSSRFCKDVIDQWGGPAGSSMNELLQTFACTVNSGCDCN